MRGVDVWYARLDTGRLVEAFGGGASARQRKAVDRTITKARRKDSTRAFAKLAHEVDGAPRIVSDPPLIVPVEDLADGAEARRIEDGVRALIDRYLASLRPDCHQLLDRYEYAHLARKVVGVGSVGTRAWIVLLLGRDESDPMFLQCKEAEPSVLAPFAGASDYDNQGRRVVEGQRIMQAASDILLGWLRVTEDGAERDYYVRQLWDWKTSATVEEMRPRDMRTYGEMCAWALARAHARSGDPIAIGAYLGSGDVFDRALGGLRRALRRPERERLRRVRRGGGRGGGPGRGLTAARAHSPGQRAGATPAGATHRSRRDGARPGATRKRTYLPIAWGAVTKTWMTAPGRRRRSNRPRRTTVRGERLRRTILRRGQPR